MTQFVLISVFDRASKTYGRVVQVASKGVALRSFTDEVNRAAADNDLNRHPDDFDLCIVGSFDDSTGDLAPTQVESFVRAKDVINPTVG